MTFVKREIGRTGLSVSTLGLGGAPLGGLFDPVDDAEGLATISAAFDAGMSYVDTAPFYGFGLSERRVGDMLRGKDYTLSTKVGRLLAPGAHADPSSMGWPAALPFQPVFDYGYDAVMRSFEDSLQRLGLDRVDILLAHDIGRLTHGDDAETHFADLIDGGYRALDELRRSGAVKAIGLGVNEAEVCRAVLDHGDWDVFLLAGRYTLLEQDPLADLLPECDARNVSIIVGGPYNSGVLVGGATWNYAAAPTDVLDRVARLGAVCARFDVPLPAAALQFPLAHPAIASVIPGLRTRSELKDTLTWASWEIPSDLWSTLASEGLIRGDAPVPNGNPFLKG